MEGERGVRYDERTFPANRLGERGADLGGVFVVFLFFSVLE